MERRGVWTLTLPLVQNTPSALPLSNREVDGHTVRNGHPYAG